MSNWSWITPCSGPPADPEGQANAQTQMRATR